jgi:hypothetical protein
MEPEGSLPCSQEPSTGPYPEPYKSNPHHPISIRSILILSTDLRLGLPSGLFPSGLPTNILYAFLVFPIRATCPAHLTLLDLIILIILGEEYKFITHAKIKYSLIHDSDSEHTVTKHATVYLRKAHCKILLSEIRTMEESVAFTCCCWLICFEQSCLFPNSISNTSPWPIKLSKHVTNWAVKILFSWRLHEHSVMFNGGQGCAEKCRYNSGRVKPDPVMKWLKSCPHAYLIKHYAMKTNGGVDV